MRVNVVCSVLYSTFLQSSLLDMHTQVADEKKAKEQALQQVATEAFRDKQMYQRCGKIYLDRLTSHNKDGH